MQPTAQVPATSSRHSAKTTTSKKQKLPAAAVEATAEAFVAGFNALPGAVKWRILQLIEEQEDEADAQELVAARAANPADFARENAIPWEQVKAEIEAQATPAKPTAAQHKAA